MTTGTEHPRPWFQVSVMLLLGLSWCILIGVGAIALLGLLLAAILAPIAFRGTIRQPHPIAIAFLILNISYFGYFAIAGPLHTPVAGYSDSLWRLAPMPIIGVLVFFLTSNQPHVLTLSGRMASWLWLSTALSTVVLIFLAAVDDDRRANTLHGNPLLVSNALFIGGLLPLTLWHRARWWGKLALSCLLLGTLIALVIWAEARAHSIFMLILGGGTWAVLCLKTIDGRHRWLWRLILCGIAAIAVVAVLYWVLVVWDHSIAVRIQNGLNTVVAIFQGQATEILDQSFEQRAVMWQAGWNDFLEQPIWGYGIQNRFTATDLPFSYTHLHNSLLTHLVAGGLPGAFLYASLVLFAPLTWVCLRVARPAYWHSLDKSQRQELLWMGIIATLFPILSGLTNVVMFESTLLALALLPIGFWVMLLPPIAKHRDKDSAAMPLRGGT